MDAQDFETMVARVLDYYDRAYAHGLEQRRTATTPVLDFVADDWLAAAPAPG